MRTSRRKTHPKLSPNDEFANFERWDRGSFGPELKRDDMLPREYTRETLKRGLAYEQSLGVNPFRFGLIGSTDAHTGLSTATGDTFFGKVALLEPTADPIRFDEVIIGRVPAARPRAAQYLARETSASGLAAVWARGNTRDDLWDALARKEVYATTGTRLSVRVLPALWHSVETEATLGCGGCCMSVTLRDYARVGQFILDGGKAGGKQVLPPTWTTEATNPQIANGTRGRGYGYFGWMPDNGAYEAIGIFGQSITTFRDDRIIIVINAAWPKATDRELSAARTAFLNAVRAAAKAMMMR